MSLNISNHSLKYVKQDETVLAYMRDIKNTKILTAEEELTLVLSAQKGDMDSQNKLIASHQRFVYALAKQYATINNDILDYVNEGNIGLITAIKTFDPSRGFRFITYASHYIRREMVEYMNALRNIVHSPTNNKYASKVKKLKNDYFNKYGAYPTENQLIEMFKDKYNMKVQDTSDLLEVTMEDIAYDRDTDHGVKAENNFNNRSASYNDYEDVVEKDYIKNMVITCINTLKEKEADIISMLYGIGKYEYPVPTDDVAIKYNITTASVNMIRNKVLDKMRNKLSNVRIAG